MLSGVGEGQEAAAASTGEGAPPADRQGPRDAASSIWRRRLGWGCCGLLALALFCGLWAAALLWLVGRVVPEQDQRAATAAPGSAAPRTAEAGAPKGEPSAGGPTTRLAWCRPSPSRR